MLGLIPTPNNHGGVAQSAGCGTCLAVFVQIIVSTVILLLQIKTEPPGIVKIKSNIYDSTSVGISATGIESEQMGNVTETGCFCEITMTVVPTRRGCGLVCVCRIRMLKIG